MSFETPGMRDFAAPNSRGHRFIRGFVPALQTDPKELPRRVGRSKGGHVQQRRPPRRIPWVIDGMRTPKLRFAGDSPLEEAVSSEPGL